MPMESTIPPPVSSPKANIGPLGRETGGGTIPVDERFFRAVIPNFQQLIEQGYRLLTVEASMRYARELRLFEALTIAIDVVELKEASVVLRLAFLRDHEEPAGLGHQRLVLTDGTGRPTAIPDDVRVRLQAHLALNGRAC